MEQVKTIDLDDPEFSNPQDYDPEQDLEIRLAPPELDSNGNPIDYMIKLSIGENKEKKKAPYARQNDKGVKSLALNVKAQIQADGTPYHNAFVQFPFGGVSTQMYNNTNSVVNLSRLLGQKAPKNLSPLDQTARLVSILENEPILPGNITWAGYCSNCQKEQVELMGEGRWPEKKNEAGEVEGHLNVTTCPECAGELTAGVKIKRLKPV